MRYSIKQNALGPGGRSIPVARAELLCVLICGLCLESLVGECSEVENVVTQRPLSYCTTAPWTSCCWWYNGCNEYYHKRLLLSQVIFMRQEPLKYTAMHETNSFRGKPLPDGHYSSCQYPPLTLKQEGGDDQTRPILYLVLPGMVSATGVLLSAPRILGARASVDRYPNA